VNEEEHDMTKVVPSFEEEWFWNAMVTPAVTDKLELNS
jgi:hypothetical protein